MHALQALLQRLQSYHPKTIDLGLDRTLNLLKKCGSPHKKLPPVIHVAGTNGKGSILSFLQSICQLAGLRVHRYTSPELVVFNERFIVSGVQVSDADLWEALVYVDKINDGNPITFFEITTVAGFVLFAHHPADIVLLETGLGGRLDSTNVVENPLCTIISNIGYDHQQFLGDSIGQIATEKAGIFRPSVPAIIAPQTHTEAVPCLQQVAHRVGSDFVPVPSVERLWDGFLVDGVAYPHPNLIGDHQYDNGATAVYALRYLCQNRRGCFEIPESAYIQGICNAVHRGRFEMIYINDKCLYVDGGHNEDASKCLARTLYDNRLRHMPMICGMLQGKDVKAFFHPLRDFITAVYTVPICHNPFASADGFSPEQLAESITQMGIKAVVCNDVTDALNKIPTHDILCAGSLHLAGDVLSLASDKSPMKTNMETI